MKPIVVLLSLILCSSALSQQAEGPNPLLDHMVGNWILKGTIDGRQTTHDITAGWVLQHRYLQLHEVAREKDSTGQAAYEAIVILGWVEKSKDYGCLWLDITGTWDFSGAGIGRGKPSGSEIPFLFKSGDGSVFHNTFIYEPASDSWKWVMDGEEGGKLIPFARLTLTRTK